MNDQASALSTTPCRKLRWKGLYVESDPDPTVPDGGGGVTWCLATQRVLGPDGRVVGMKQCIAGRACFEE